MEDKKVYPKVLIALDCVPRDELELKNNLKVIYDVCNEVLDDPKCFYTEKEIIKIKGNINIQKNLNIKFI